MKTIVRDIQIEYTGRAMGEDAQAAMRGDIERGLVELITNADDEYVRGMFPKGKITVEVEHRRGRSWTLRVLDRATGMSAEDMANKLARLGARTSGFEDDLRVRGNQGRGAKDLIAFGKVHFESIKDAGYAKLTLTPGQMHGRLEGPRPATEDDRSRLGIPRRNGMVVTVEAMKTVRCPQHDRLVRLLRTNPHLRSITSDPRRELELVNLNKSTEVDRIRYAVDVDDLECVMHQELPIPNYPAVIARLRVWRRPERADAGNPIGARLFGVLVQGRRAVYEQTTFGFERNPHAWRLFGELDCPYIDDLAKGYDDRVEAGLPALTANPMPIIDRRRDALVSEHPFAEALHHACKPIMEQLVRQEQERERQSPADIMDPETKRELARLSRELSRMFEEGVRELDEDDWPEISGEGELTIKVVPPNIVLPLGQEKTATVLVDEGLGNGKREVTLDTSEDGVIDLLDGSMITLTPHRARDGILAGQVRMRAVLEGEVVLSATIGDLDALALVNVRAPKEGEDPEPPQALEFEKPRYRIGWTKKKTLLIRAPADRIEEYGTVAHVQSDSAGVVVRRAKIDMREVDAGWYEATAQVEGRDLVHKGTLTVRLGEESAHCMVRVEAQEESSVPGFNIKYELEDYGPFRHVFEEPDGDVTGGTILKVCVRHPALRSILGEHGEGQHLEVWKGVLAEVLADAMVRRLTQHRYRGRGALPDPGQLYVEMDELITQYLPKVQRAVGAVPSLPALPPSSAPTDEASIAEESANPIHHGSGSQLADRGER